MSRRHSRFARAAVVAVLALIGPLLPGAQATPSASPAAQLAAAAPVGNGKYVGTTLEGGKPVKKEWVRFKVKKHKSVAKFRSRVWVHCYVYPNQYYSLPLVFKMPKTKIHNKRIDRSWQKTIRLENDTKTLKGRVKLRFRKKGKVTGKISIDVANCATRLGDPPYWVKLKAKHR